MKKEEKLIYIFTSISATIYILESLIPKPFPWLRFGFSNIITLILLYSYSYSFAFKVLLLRVCIGNFFTGSLFTPGFFLSLFGAIASLNSMYISKNIFKRFISPIGVSICGAESHILTQLYFAYLILIKDKSIFILTPYLMLFSLITGFIVGIIAKRVIEELVDILS